MSFARSAPPLRSSEARRVLESLLRSREPSIRWKARTQILNEPSDSRAVLRLQEEIRQSVRTRRLLARQGELGRAGRSRRVYYKWQGIHWVLASLADLGFPPGDPRLFPLRDRALELWLRPYFFQDFRGPLREKRGRHPGVPLIEGRSRRCASQQGNALLYLTCLGLGNEACGRLVERLLHWQWPDGGWNCDVRPSVETSSFVETLLPMRGLAAYARSQRSGIADEGAQRASEVFLRRHLYRRVRDGRVIRAEFVQLHYPLYYHYDVLGGLRAMRELGRLGDPRCDAPLDLLETKRLPRGFWSAERRYYRSHSPHWKSTADYVEWGPVGVGRANEWVTADALSVLAAAGRVAF